MSSAIKFKVYLVNESSEIQEVRRFTSDSDAVTNFLYLREKLLSFFPKLREKNFSITWKDNEGDSITVSSDEELEIALNEMYPLPRKLYLTCLAENAKKTEGKSQGVLHPDVICDACDEQVQGFRYKCVVCEDYDLCANCEALQFHPEHFMLRISQPLQWSSHTKSQLLRDVKKFVIKMKKDRDDSCKSRSRRRHSGYSNECSFPPFSAFWANLPEECPMKKPTETAKATESANATKSSRTASSQEEGKEGKMPPKPFKIPVIDIPAILEAFGIDIGIEVATDNKPSTSESNATPETASQGTSPMGESPSKKFPGEGKPLIERSDKKDHKNDDKASVSDRESTSSRKSSVSKTAAAEDWTMVDKIETPIINRASFGSDISESVSCSSVNDNVATEKKPAVTSAVPSAPAEPNLTNKIYPQLKNEVETVYHPDPKVHKALQTLVSMGFSNEGGLLAYLLQKEECNINKVLDLLQGTHL